MSLIIRKEIFYYKSLFILFKGSWWVASPSLYFLLRKGDPAFFLELLLPSEARGSIANEGCKARPTKPTINSQV